MNNNKVFALDIGTRSVTGIILEKQNDLFTVSDFCMKEHKNRSMLDGQIHDVVEVSNIIKAVKMDLETRNGPLENVCVAAAGRALKTKQATASIELQQQPIIEQETIKHLELSAVQAAQLKLTNQKNDSDYSNYYCVGYSILNYTLDHEIIGSLIDQNGEEASVEIIATFLPKVVVESLLAALTRADLKMEALTLEPIAAIQVLIPESMRRLNVALIDIGAGTSDIAITNHGTISAYGMVPMAGDEITEAISDHYLLDFPDAEQTKRNIVTNGEDIVADILGFETTITYDELVENVSESIHILAQKLTHEMIKLNKQAPKAVMLIGGGSLTPEITKTLANQLQLPENRVAVRNLDAIQTLTKNDALPAGPDFITPIGIAITAKENPIHYISIKVNNKTLRMFEMKELTIGDCLIQASIDIRRNYGRPGLASIITMNGQQITLPGGYGEPPTIHLNGVSKSVDQVVQDGDHIFIEKGINGAPPHVMIKDLIGDIPTKTLYYKEQAYLLKPTYHVNGKTETDQYIVNDKDHINVKQSETMEDFLKLIKVDNLNTSNSFAIFVNQQKIHLTKGPLQIYVNQQLVGSYHTLKNNDQIELVHADLPTIQDLLTQQEKRYSQSIHISFNGKKVEMQQQLLAITRNGIEIPPQTTVNPQDQLNINEKKFKPFIFQDVFRYVDIDVNHVTSTFKIYKNKKASAFHDFIQNGDALEIIWD